MSRHLLVVETNCVAGADEEFNRWYDEVHVPQLLELDGFLNVSRYRVADAQMGRSVPPQRYVAMYEIEADDPQQALETLNAGQQHFEMTPLLVTGPREVRVRLYTALGS